MKKLIKFLLWTFISVAVILIGLMAGFIYKIKYGFPVSYETEIPSIAFPEGQRAVLLFSKTTGYRHGASIDTAKIVFAELAKRNQWFLYETEAGGVFNNEQLAKFKTVIFNNSSGRVLNEEQEKALEEYVKNGGSFIGIHGAGDFSHHWDWYENNLIGAHFSHHPMAPQFQEAVITREAVPDSTIGYQLEAQWTHTDEWYVFFENPRKAGFQIIYTIDGEKIIPNGNFLWLRGRDFGMGKDHPVAWYKSVEKGRTFYTSIGHDTRAWKQDAFIRLIENAMR